MRGRVWRLRLDRTSTSAVCASPYAAATARFQSVQSLYRASTELHAHRACNTKRAAPGYVVTLAGEWTPTAYSRSLSPANIRRKNARGPPPGPLRESFAQRRNLIPTITRLSDMAMVARGGGDGTDIGSERRPVRDRKAQLNCRSHWRHEKNERARISMPRPVLPVGSSPLDRQRNPLCRAGRIVFISA